MIKAKDYVVRRDKIFKELVELLEELNHMNCFDCGKSLSRHNIGIFLDKSGIIVNCYSCTWKKISIKNFWKKTLGAK